MWLMYERETAEERGKANFAGLALETINELSGPGFDDVTVGLDGTGTESTVPSPPTIGVSVPIENLKIFRGAKVLARIIPCNGRITRSAS